MKGFSHIASLGTTAIRLHWTTLVLPICIVAYAYYRDVSVNGILWMLSFFVAIVVCVLLHETGHAFIAKRQNIKVVDILLLPFGGVARLNSLPQAPMHEMQIALAGPAVNLIIALVLGPALYIWPQHEWFPLLNNFDLGSLLVCLCLFNFAVFVFNLIPVFPLDGGRIMRAILRLRMPALKATRMTAWISRAIAVVLVIFSFIYGYFFLSIFGVFVFLVSGREEYSAMIQHYLDELTISKIAVAVRGFHPDTPVKDILSYLNKNEQKGAIIVDDCCPIGFVHVPMLLMIPDQETLVGNIEMPTVICHDSDTSLREISKQFSAFPRSIAVEEFDGRPIGYLNLEMLENGLLAYAKNTVRIFKDAA